MTYLFTRLRDGEQMSFVIPPPDMSDQYDRRRFCESALAYSRFHGLLNLLDAEVSIDRGEITQGGEVRVRFEEMR